MKEEWSGPSALRLLLGSRPCHPERVENLGRGGVVMETTRLRGFLEGLQLQPPLTPSKLWATWRQWILAHHPDKNAGVAQPQVPSMLALYHEIRAVPKDQLERLLLRPWLRPPPRRGPVQPPKTTAPRPSPGPSPGPSPSPPQDPPQPPGPDIGGSRRAAPGLRPFVPRGMVWGPALGVQRRVGKRPAACRPLDMYCPVK